MHALRVTAALAVVATVALAACGDDSGSSAASTAAPAQAQSQTGLAGTSWILSSFKTPSGSSVDAVTSAPAALAFTADDKVSGSTGCNDFSGTYTSDEEALTITLGPMTQKACTDPALTAQETALVAQLAKVASYTSDSTGLTLKDSSGATVLAYAPGLSGVEGAWTATGVNNGKGAVQTTTQTEQITAVFGPDGDLAGSGGCNDYNATYAVSGDALTLGPVAATKKACADDVMTEENAYFAALGNVATFDIKGTTLTLRDSQGATQVTYTRDR